MTEPLIRFDDGAAYDDYMAPWSRSVGIEFLQWLAQPAGLRWLDVGCGTGAFTQLLLAHAAPALVHGIDPSAAQIGFARQRVDASVAHFALGDAMALDYPAGAFDAAVMALVIFFVPEPGRSVVEMARVVRPGGTVAAYAWDMAGGGFPYMVLGQQMRLLGLATPMPPSVEASDPEVMRQLWRAAGLQAVTTKAFTVQRRFADFESYWNIASKWTSVRQILSCLPAPDLASLKRGVQDQILPDPDGQITITARAHACMGRVAAPNSRP